MSKSQQNVTLRPMTEPEYLIWLPVQIREYADSKIQSGNWSKTNALELAQQQTSDLLSAGLKTEHHKIFSIVSCSDRVVLGNIWVKLSGDPGDPVAFLYNFSVGEIHRGQGFGTAALKILEEHLRKEGVRNLRLHVFGFNIKAQHLYRRLGFEVTNINMAKDI